MLLYRGMDVNPCDCGGPQYGTPHAPDCRYILDCMEVDEILECQDDDDAAMRAQAEQERSEMLAEMYNDHIAAYYGGADEFDPYSGC